VRFINDESVRAGLSSMILQVRNNICKGQDSVFAGVAVRHKPNDFVGAVICFSAENTCTAEPGGNGLRVFEPIGVTPAETQAERSTSKIGATTGVPRRRITPFSPNRFINLIPSPVRLLDWLDNGFSLSSPGVHASSAAAEPRPCALIRWPTPTETAVKHIPGRP
jgi:hypothetical protein